MHIPGAVSPIGFNLVRNIQAVKGFGVCLVVYDGRFGAERGRTAQRSRGGLATDASWNNGAPWRFQESLAEHVAGVSRGYSRSEGHLSTTSTSSGRLGRVTWRKTRKATATHNVRPIQPSRLGSSTV